MPFTHWHQSDFLGMLLPRVPFRKIFGFLLTICFHITVFLFLRDRIDLPAEQIGQSIVAKIISEQPRTRENISLAPLNLQSPTITIQPPQLDLPLGRPVVSQPMVVIEAQLSPHVSSVVSAAEYSVNQLGRCVPG